MALARSDGAERWEPITSINITPLVDVSLVLVLIFMLSMPFLVERVLRVDSPRRVASVAEGAVKPILVEMDGKSLRVEGRPTSVNELEPLLKSLGRGREVSAVALSAVREIPHGEVVSVLDHIADAGVADLELLQPPEDPYARR